MLALAQRATGTTSSPPARPTAARGRLFAPPIACLRRLSLRDFRNYRQLRLELDGRPVVLTGDNGAGKTNLLEAVSLLAPGRGLRRARLEALDLDGHGPWALSATLDAGTGRHDIITGRAGAGERRRIEIDGMPARSSAELALLLGLVWLTPAHDRLFLDAPAARRRFLDRLVLTIDPDHATRLAAFERGLRERLAVLRRPRPDAAWLVAIEQRLAELGIAVAAARQDLVSGLDTLPAAAGDPFPNAGLASVGEVETWLQAMPALEAEGQLAASLATSRPQDAQQGGAAHGPHRSDLLVTDVATGRAAAGCSTGRQKALLIALVLAHARLHRERLRQLPILLLDEVAAHLDGRHRAALFATLLDLGAQAWLTGTDPALFAPLAGGARHFDVNDGTLQER